MEKKERKPKVALLSIWELMRRFGGDQGWLKKDFISDFLFLWQNSQFTHKFTYFKNFKGEVPLEGGFCGYFKTISEEIFEVLLPGFHFIK